MYIYLFFCVRVYLLVYCVQQREDNKKTSPCNIYPLTPHFYKEKMGYVWVFVFFFLFLRRFGLQGYLYFFLFLRRL